MSGVVEVRAPRQWISVDEAERLDAAREWVSVEKAERMTDRSKWSWRRDCYAGRCGSSKVGRRLFIPLDEIQRIMAEGYRPALDPK